MEAMEQVLTTAEAAWESLRDHRIPPTPRNFEIWYGYLGDDKPALRTRIDKAIAAGEAWTPGSLDKLYRDFFATHVDVSAIRDGSHELTQIAMQMSERVVADRDAIDAFANILDRAMPVLKTGRAGTDIPRAVGAMKAATGETSERLRALEQLFTASVMRIQELKEALIRAETEATRDALTGLANRRMFDAALLQATSGNASEVALLLLDIDHFKKFNDKHGHLLGDNVLRLVASVLTSHIKGRDTAARYGGEEFAIILVGAHIAAAATVGEQIRDLLERRPLVNRNTGQKLGVVTCSVGVAVFRPGEALADFVDRADQSLYRAKRTGRNRVCTEECV